MNAKPDQPAYPETDLAAAQARIRQLEEAICEAEQELQAATQIIDEQDFNLECLRLQLEAADLTIDEAVETRRMLENKIAELEDALADEPCAVPVPNQQAPQQQPGYPPGYTPNPVVEAMIAQFKAREVRSRQVVFAQEALN